MTSHLRTHLTRIVAQIAVIGLTLGAMICQAPYALGQIPEAASEGQKPNKAAERLKALTLSYEHHNLEALPLLEALASADPTDNEVREELAISLITKSATTTGEEAATILKRSRSILLDLKKKGKLSSLGEILADSLPADGGAPVFSKSKEVQAAMTEGENAFARRDYDKARLAYKRAIALDPRLYEAALFVGDTYFAQKDFARARDWFARTVLINPDRDEAHRYLGDAQMEAGDMDAARISYIDAYISEPYIKRTWFVLNRWCEANKIVLGHPQIVPKGLTNEPDVKKGERESGAVNDGRIHWHHYSETRKVWAERRFKMTYPNENVYRHSLGEEADALRQVARSIASDVKVGKIKEPHPSFANLIKLDEEGLLDAYVLFARADEGIAQDYEPYRATHRSELRRYVSQYLLPIKDGKVPALMP